MIDLSFLTEEEQEAIMKVLQRDAELKKAEEDRVRVLEDTIEDTNELKNKTGQWFYDAKSKRHRDKIHGADLIRASIKKKKTPTIAELSQSRIDKTKKSWVNNVNKDLFVPPELFGVMEEPDREDEEEKTQGKLYRSAPKVDNVSFYEPPQSSIKAVSSPSKQRKNPFNDPSLEVGFELNSKNHISENGTAHLYDLPEKEIMASSQRSERSKKIPEVERNEDSPNFSDSLDEQEKKSEQKIPKPKVRTVTYKIADAQSDSDSSFSKPAKRNDSLNGTGARKGILKRSPSSSSTDSEILRISHSLDSQSKTLSPNSPILEGEAEKNYLRNPPDQFSQNSIDRLKQVRFTPVDVPDTLPQTPDTHKGREIGEFDLLESDYAKNSKDDIDGVKPLYGEHESFQNSIHAHPETVDVDSDVAAASDEEDRDITLGVSSDLHINLKTEAPEPEEVLPSSLIITQPRTSSSELLQEESSPVDSTSITTLNHIFGNIGENEEPTSGSFPNREASDLSNLASQKSTLSIDQQPVYAKINTPRLSKLDSSDDLQGKESIDESESSRKTETMVMENTKPKHDDNRDNFNVPQNANLLKFNADVQESKDKTFRTSKHFSGKFESAANVGLPGITKSVDRPELAIHISQELHIKAIEPNEKEVIVGKSGGAGSDETSDYLINRNEEQKSTLGIRSKAKVDNVYSDKQILKSPQQDDDEKAKHCKNRNVDIGYPVSLYSKYVGESRSDSLEQDSTPNSENITWKSHQVVDHKEAAELHVVSTINASMELHQNGLSETTRLSKQSEHNPVPFENASHPQDIIRQHSPIDSLIYGTRNRLTEQETGDSIKATCFSPDVPGLHQIIKEDCQSFNKTNSIDGKIHHKSTAKGQYNIVEGAVKDIVEIVSKTEVPSKSNVSEFNIALVKLESEANASLNSGKVSSADQNVNSQPLFQNSGNSITLADEAKARFTEEVDTLKKSTLFQAQEEIQQSMKCHVAEGVPQEVVEIMHRTVVPPNATNDEFDRKLEKLHREESAELYLRYPMHGGVLQKPISTCKKQNAPGYSKEPAEKTLPPAKYEVEELNTELERENEGSTLPLLPETLGQDSHLDSLNREVKEVILKTIAPPKSDLNEFKLNLEKLHMESYVPLSAEQQTANEVLKMEENHCREHPNIPKYPTTEIVDQSIADQYTERREIKSQGEELLEQLKSPTHNKPTREQGYLKYPKDKSEAQEVKEVVYRTAAPQKDISLFHNGLHKLSTEVSESSFPMDLKPSELVRMTIKHSEDFQRPPPTETVETSVIQSKVELGESKPDVTEVLRRCKQYPRKPKEPMTTRIREVKGHHTEVSEVGLEFIGPPKGSVDEFKCDSENIQNPIVHGSFPVLHKSTQNIEEKMFSPHKHPLEQAMGEEIMVVEKTSIAPKGYISDNPTSSSVHLEEVPMQIPFQEKDSTKQIESVFQFSKDEAVKTTIMSPKSELLEFNVEGQQHSESPRKNSVLIIKITDVQPNFEHGASNTSVNKLLNEPSLLHNKMFREQRSISHPQEELLQEVQEVIEKAAVPTKSDVSEFKKGLQKLQKEASEPLQNIATEIPSVSSPLQNANEFVKSVSSKPVKEGNTNINKPMEVSTPLCDNSLQEQSSVRKPEKEEHPQEVTEVVQKMAVPTKTELYGFKIGLQTLCQEASEPLLPEVQKSPGVTRSQELFLPQKEQCYIEGSKEDTTGKMAVPRITNPNTLLHHALVLEEKASKQLSEEVKEVIEKSASPATDVSSFNTALNKMFVEASLSFQVAQEDMVQTKQEDDFSQKQSDIAESTTVPPNSDLMAFQVGSEKLQSDALLSKSLVHKESYGMANSPGKMSECPGNEMPLMGKTNACPNSDCREYKTSVIKLRKNTQLQRQEPINYSKESEPSQEISEYVIKTFIPPKHNLNEFKIGLMKLLEEASMSHVPELQESTAVSKDMDSAQEQEHLIEVQKEEYVGNLVKPALQQATDLNDVLPSPDPPLIPTLLVKQSAPEHPKEKIALQEVKEVVVKTVKPEPDVHDFDTALKKLLTPDTHLSPVQLEGSVQAKVEEQLSTQQNQSPLTCQTEEIIERRIALSQDPMLEFKGRLEKGPKEALMSTSPGRKETQKALSTEKQSPEEDPSKDVLEFVREHSSFKSAKEEVFPQEVTEVMIRTAVPPKTGLYDFKIGIEKLQKQALEPLSSVFEKANTMNRSCEKDFIQEERNLVECMNEEVVENGVRMARTTTGNSNVDAPPHDKSSVHGNYLVCFSGNEVLPKEKKVVRTTVSSQTNNGDCNSDVRKVTIEDSQSSSLYTRQTSKPDEMPKYFILQKQSELKIAKDETAKMTCAPTKAESEQKNNLLLVSPKEQEFAPQVQCYADFPRKEISTVEKVDAQTIIDCGELNPSVSRQPNELPSLMHHKALEDQRSLELPKVELIPLEVSEVIVQTVAPMISDSNEFKIRLQKLQKEASDPEVLVVEKPNIVVRVQRKDLSQEPLSLPGGSKEGIMKVENAAIPPGVGPSGQNARLNSYLQPKLPLQESPQETEHIQEVKEVIVKSISPKDDLCEFHKGLQKLVTEASLSSPVLQITDGQTKIKEGFTKTTSLKFTVEELMERTLAPAKTPIVEFKAALENLQMEALKSASTGDQKAYEDLKIQKHSTMEKNHLAYPRKNNAENGGSKFNSGHSELNIGLNKLNKESSPLHPEALEEKGVFKHCEDKQPLHEVREVIVKTTAPPKSEVNLKDKLQKLHKPVPDPLLLELEKTSIVFRTEGKDSVQEPQGSDIVKKKDVVDNVNMACAPPAAKPIEDNPAHIVLLPHLFVSETTGLKDSFLTEPHHVPTKIETSEVSSNNSIKKDTVPLNEVREHVEKTTVPSKKDLYKFVSGLQKLVEESSSPLPHTTLEQQRPLQSSKHGSSFEHVKEYNFGSLKLPRAGLTEYGKGREKSDINASTTNAPADKGSSNVAKIQQMLSKGKLFQKHQRNTSCMKTAGVVSLKAQKETVQKTTVLPKTALSEFKAGLNTVNKEASPSSSVLHKDSNINADIYKGKFKHNQRDNQSGVYAGQVSEKIDKHVKRLMGDSKQDLGHSQSMQSKISVKVLQRKYQHVEDHQEEFPPPEVMKAFDETIANPKTDKSAFDIGSEKMYNEFFDASTTVVRPADQRNIVDNIPDVQHGRVDDWSKIPSMPVTKESKLGPQVHHQQETLLPQKVNKSVILSKIKTSAFQDGHIKHGLDASDTLLTFDKQTNNLENTSGNMSDHDWEKIDQTVYLGEINSLVEKKGMLHSERNDVTKKNTQLLQNSSLVKQKYTDGLERALLLREATDNTSTAEQGMFPIGFENLQGGYSENLITLNRASNSTIINYQNNSKYHGQPSSTYPTLTSIPIRDKHCEEIPQSVQQKLSTKKIQLAPRVLTGYQLDTSFIPQKIVNASSEAFVGSKPEICPFNVNSKAGSIDNVIESPTSNKSSRDEEEKSKLTQTKLSTTRIQLHRNVFLQHQKEKYKVQAALDPLERPVPHNLGNIIGAASGPIGQPGRKQDSRTDTILHTPVSLSEKSKLSNNQVVLSLSHPCCTGPTEDKLYKCGNQQTDGGNLGAHAPVDNEVEMSRLNRKLEFLHSTAHSHIHLPKRTNQSEEINCEGIELSEDPKAGSDKKSQDENSQELRSSSFRRKTTVEKDQKPVVRSSSVAFQLSYPYGKDKPSRPFVSNLPRGNVKLDRKSYSDFPRDHS